MLIKLKWLGYRTVKKNYNNMLTRFHAIPERNGRTDRQICYINIARQNADNNTKKCGRRVRPTRYAPTRL